MSKSIMTKITDDKIKYNIYSFSYDDIIKFDCGIIGNDSFPDQINISTFKNLRTSDILDNLWTSILYCFLFILMQFYLFLILDQSRSNFGARFLFQSTMIQCKVIILMKRYS